MMIFKNRPLAFTIFCFSAALYLSFYLNGICKAIFCGIMISCALIVIIIKHRFTLFAVSLLTVSLAIGFSFLFYDIPENAGRDLIGTEHCIDAEITDIKYSDDKTDYLEADVVSIDGAEISLKIKANIKNSDTVLNVGDTVRINGIFSNISDDTDGFDENSYYRAKGIYLGFESDCENVEIVGHRENLIKNFFTGIRKYCASVIDLNCDKEYSALIKALTIGDKSNLSTVIKSNFSRLGASHILAISGMHLSIIMSSIMLFAEIFTVNRRICAIIVSLLCVFYILISGASFSVIRSGIMFIVMSLSVLFKRKNDSLTSLFTALFLITLFSPGSIFDIGLILSFSSTFGIIVITPYFLKKLKDLNLNKVVNYIIITVITTLSALSFSVIPIALYFNGFSVISILSNLILCPIITLILFASPLLIIFSPITPAARGLGYAINLIVKKLLSVVSYMAGIDNTVIGMNYPFVKYCIFAFAAVFLLVLHFRRRSMLVLPFISFFLCFGICYSVFSLNLQGCCDSVFISRASNDSVILRDSDYSIIIDFAKTSKTHEKINFKLLSTELYCCDLDYWILSCYNQNYRSGLVYALENYRIKNLLINEPTDENENLIYEDIKFFAEKYGCKVGYFSYDESFYIGEIKINISPPVTFSDTDVNIPHADLYVSDRRITYFGSAYFDYRNVNDKSSDYLFSGSFGYNGKRLKTPDFNTEHLIYTDHKYSDISKITYIDKIQLTGKYYFYKTRIWGY